MMYDKMRYDQNTQPTAHGFAIIIIIITKEYDYGGVMSEDCKDTLQTKQ